MCVYQVNVVDDLRGVIDLMFCFIVKNLFDKKQLVL